jgi:WD40 repeat protein
LRFELNRGQIDPQVRFLACSQSGDMFLTASEMVLRVREASSSRDTKPGNCAPSEQAHTTTNSAVVRMQTVDANPNPRITGLDPLPGTTNYFIGNNPKQWHTNVPSYAKVKYENIYPGIDLIYYGNEGNLEYDFNVAPGADTSRIVLSVEGADGVHIDDVGNLVLQTAVGDVSQHAPRIYQELNGTRQEIAGGYKLIEPSIRNPKSKIQNQLVAFALGDYDASKPLVIDPELVYATYFGGGAETDIKAIAVDAAGSVYVAGDTFAHDFPTKNPLQSSNNHSQSLSAIISKLSPDGLSLVYSTYLGGSDTFALDVAVGIALDSTGAAYVTGVTGSSDFPTKNAIQPARNGNSQNLFVTRLSADGSSLVYSTYLGGSGTDEPKGIRLDSANAAYVFGKTGSSDFPLVNPTQATFAGGSSDGFLSIINGNGSQLLFSTFIGGPGDDNVSSCAIDPDTGDVYLSGFRGSPNQTTDSLSVSPQAQGDFGKYVERLKRIRPQDYELVKDFIADFFEAPPLRTLSDEVKILLVEQQIALLRKIQLGIYDDGNGQLTFTNPQPSTNNAISLLQGAKPQAADPGARISLANLNSNVQKTVHFGGSGTDIVSALVGDSQGAVYVVGSTNSRDFPTVNPIQSTYGGSFDGFVAVFAPDTMDELFATYIGGSGHEEANGIALDPQGNIYIAGQTTSDDFPTKNAFQPTHPAPNGVMQGQGNSFIVKISSLGTIPTGPDFSLGFDSPTVTGQAGTKARITVNINRAGGFTGNVTVTPATPGGGIKPKPADPITTTDNTATFKMKIGGGVTSGPHQLTFTGTDGAGHTRTATVTLIVQ